MFRYLIYRTDLGNTIVRESQVAGTTGVNEAEIFTDYVIPTIQPLFLYRVTGGSNVDPNLEQNVNDYLAEINPITGSDPVTYDVYTGFTATTNSRLDTVEGDITFLSGATYDQGLDIQAVSAATDQNASDITFLSGQTDNKIDKVTTGTTGNFVILTSDGSLEDAGIDLNAVLAGTGSTSLNLFTGYTATTETRLQGIEGDIVFLSGETSGNTQAILDNDADIVVLSGAIDQNTTDIQTVSAATVTNANDIQTVSAATDQNVADISFISGETAANDADIAFLSGVTDTKQDQLSAGEGINSTLLSSNDTIQVDLSSFNATGGFNITLTGSTNAVITDLRSIARGLEYAGDYTTNFTIRSLVDKAYVDAVAAGLDLKESVVVATTSGETNIDLSLGTFGGVIDGYTLADGDRVLIKNQDAAREDNGIYIWSSSSSTFARAIDFDGANVTSGAFTFTETGNTNGGRGFVLISQDPIAIGTTEIIFTQFSDTGSVTAGNGINIINGSVSVDGATIAGDFLNFVGNQFNVTGLTTVSDFNTYTGATETRLQGIEGDITFLSGQTDLKVDQSDFDSYSASTDTRITTNENDIIFLSGQTDLKVDQSDFDTYTGDTDARLDNIETSISGITGGTYVEVEDFTGYTATTETRFQDVEADISFISGVTDTKLDTSEFTGFTASTQANELFLIHTGGTDINTIIPTEIVWNSAVTTNSAYNYSGGSSIFILETGEYEVSYNVVYTQTGGNADIGIGGNIVLNNTNVLDNTAGAGYTSRNNAAGGVILSPITLSLSNGDKLDLSCFRTGRSGTANTRPNCSILIKKKSTLQ